MMPLLARSEGARDSARAHLNHLAAVLLLRQESLTAALYSPHGLRSTLRLLGGIGVA